jgi:hypothetical protein
VKVSRDCPASQKEYILTRLEKLKVEEDVDIRKKIGQILKRFFPGECAQMGEHEGDEDGHATQQGEKGEEAGGVSKTTVHVSVLEGGESFISAESE